MKKVITWLGVIIAVALVAFIAYIVISAVTKPDERTITINFNGQIASEIDVQEGESIKVDDLISQIEIEGYEVVALYDNAELSGQPLTGEITISEDLTLYASCQRLLALTLSYDGQIWRFYGKEGTVLANTINPEKQHARFLGWADNDQNILLSDTASYIFSAEDFTNYQLTLTALFEEANLIQFNTNGGATIDSQYLYDGELVTLPTISREHYVFTGWQTSGGSYPAGYQMSVQNSMTFTAQWRAEQYSLIYQDEHGSQLGTATVNYGESISMLRQADPEEGYYSAGWMINGTTYANTITVPDFGEDGAEVIARSTYNKESYIIKFGALYASESIDDMRVTYGDRITLPSVERAGYDFLGWEYDDQIYSGSYVVPDLGVGGISYTFMAQFDGKNLTLTFDYAEVVLSGQVDSINYKVGDDFVLSSLPAPTYNEPLVLDGWYMDQNYTTEATVARIEALTENTTLYAKVNDATDANAFGQGTKSDPYRVYNGEQFNELMYAGSASCQVKAGEYIKLMDDVEMLDSYFTVSERRTMNINIDGGGYTLTVTKTIAEKYAGTLENIRIKFNDNYSLYRDSCMAVVELNYGVLRNVTLIKQNIDIYIDSDNRTPYMTFALLTESNYGTIENCTNYANIDINTSDDPQVAIFSGTNYNTIDYCFNYGNITANGNAKVAVYTITNGGNITNCETYGDINAYRFGIVAYQISSDTVLNIENCIISGNFTCTGDITLSTIFGRVYQGAAQYIYISNISYNCQDINIIAILDANSSIASDNAPLITDLETVKTYLPNVDFDSINYVSA